MSSFGFLACITFLGATFFVAYATDPTHLQDFCVATDDIHNARKKDFSYFISNF